MTSTPQLLRAQQWALLMMRWFIGNSDVQARWLDDNDTSWTWAGPLNLGIALPFGWPTVLARCADPATVAHADTAMIAATNALVRAHALPFDALAAPDGTRALICSTPHHAFTFVFAPDALTHLPPITARALTITFGPAPPDGTGDQLLALDQPVPVVARCEDGSLWHADLWLDEDSARMRFRQQATEALPIRFDAVAGELNAEFQTPLELSSRGTLAHSDTTAALMRNPLDPTQWAVAILAESPDTGS